jgi:L-asparagine transporter-like permease
MIKMENKSTNKEELKILLDKFQKVIGVFAILFTVMTILCDPQSFKTVFISTLSIYSIYVIIRFINKKLL